MSDENKKDEKWEMINKLKKDIKANLESLKKDISISLKTSKDRVDKLSTIEKIIKERSKSFIDYYGSFPSLSQDVKNKLPIEKSNLITSITKFFKDVNLETVYLYVSILKMLDVELVKDFKDHALETLKNQIHESLFTAVDNEVPDPFNNFYGLAVLSEVKAFENKDFLDLEKIKNYLLIELNSFTPKAVSKNYFLLVCIRLLEKAGLEIETPEQKLEDKLLNFNLLQSENIRIISDTFYFLSSLKLLDQKEKIKDLSDEYMQQIKDYLSNVNLNKMTLTDQSQLLLIIDLLNQQEQEKELISELLNKLFNVTTFFNSDLENEEFYWQKDITAYLIELTMLYWTLLATIQYQDLIE